MTKRWVCIFSRDGESLHLIVSSDVKKTIKKFHELPSMNWPEKPNTLVFIEEFNNADDAFKRLDILHAMTLSAKKVLIEQQHDRSEQILNSL